MALDIKPISKKSLAAAVFEQLRDQIVQGDMEPGESLPSERILCDRLGVNRGAVREGLKRLEQAGLVSIHQGGATSVRDFRKSAGLEILGALIVGPAGRINTHIVRSIIDMRTNLALELAERAAQHASQALGDDLMAVVATMREQPEDIKALQTLAMRYWGLVVSASKSLPYQLAYNSMSAVYSQIQSQLSQALADEVCAFDDYEALARALAKGQARAARNHSGKIVSRGARAIESILEELDTVQ